MTPVDNLIFTVPQVAKAYAFASAAHGAIGQKRKYTGEPYIVHPHEVANIVYKVAPVDKLYTMVQAALLHDVVEDTELTVLDILIHFGADVANLVSWLTDVSKPEDGNRSQRKAIDRAHTHAAPFDAQTIKVADLIANTRDITAADPDFAVVYMEEKRLLLEGMKADQVLMNVAWGLIKEFEATLEKK